MDLQIIPKKLSGTVTPPPSKSIAHRLLIAAALADVPGHLKNHRPTETVLGKLQFPRAFGKPLSVV